MRKLLAIQGLRALAAAMVVQAHALENFARKALGGSGSGGFGELGVQLFFCISGFIIYKSAHDLPTGARTAWLFTKKRIIRIAPIYWLVTLLYVLKGAAAGHPPSNFEVLKSLFFIPYTDGIGLVRPILGVGWSLNYEMFFYMLVALTLLLPRQVRLTTIFACLSMFIMAGYVVFGESAPPSTTSVFLLGNKWLLFFMLGLAVARLTSLKKMPMLSWGVAFGCSCALLGLHMLLISTVIHHEYVELPASMFFCGAAVLASAMGVSENDPDTLAARTLVKSGDCSYSTYLIHGTILGISARVAGSLTEHDWSFVFSLLMVVVCTLAGRVMHRFLEEPITQLLNRLLIKRLPR